MKKLSADKKKKLKELNTKLKKLQEKLVETNNLEGKDDYITVKVRKNQSRFDRIKKQGESDIGLGTFYLEIDVKAKKKDVFFPPSISSSRKPTGFMYRIEGTAEGELKSASVASRGEGITQVKIGTLQYTEIPAGKTATFRLQIEITGQIKRVYKIIIHRINFKLTLNDKRYQQYLKEIESKDIKFG